MTPTFEKAQRERMLQRRFRISLKLVWFWLHRWFDHLRYARKPRRTYAEHFQQVVNQDTMREIDKELREEY